MAEITNQSSLWAMWQGAAVYKTISDIYNTTGSVVDGSILLRQGTETDINYTGRKAFVQPSNITRRIVESRYIKIFSEPIIRTRETDARTLKKLYAIDSNCDNMGNSRNAVMKRIGELLSLLDTCLVVGFNFNTSNMTEAEQEAARAYPYFQVVEPQAYIESNYQVDNFGNILEFAYIYFDGPKQMVRWFTPESVITLSAYDVDYDTDNLPVYSSLSFSSCQDLLATSRETEGDTETPNAYYHATGQQPLKLVDMSGVSDGELFHTPSTYQAAKADFSIMNHRSESDDTIRKNNFALLIITAANPEAFKNGTAQTSNHNAYVIGERDSVDFKCPPMTGVDAAMKYCQQLKEDVYMDEGIRYSSTTQAQSGKSKEVDNETSNNYLSFFAQDLQNIDEWMEEVIQAWLGVSYWYSITYKTDYTNDDIDTILQRLQILLEISQDKYDRVKKLLMQKATEVVFAGNDDRIKEAAEAIENETPQVGLVKEGMV